MWTSHTGTHGRSCFVPAVAHSHPASPAKHHESGLGASFASHVAAASLPLPSLSRNPYVYPGHSALGMGATVGSSSKLYSPSGGRI